MRNFLLSIVFACYGIGAQENKEITILWDTSYSMLDKSLNNELQYLEDFFLEHKNAKVSLITFSNQIEAAKEFIVEEGNWEALETELKDHIVYDGLSDFQLLRKVENEGLILLFSDGIGILPRGFLELKGEVSVFNSSPTGEVSFLKQIARLNNGEYVSLTDRSINNNDSFYTAKVYGLDSISDNSIVVKVNNEIRDIKVSNDKTLQFDANPGDSISFTINQAQRVNKVLGNQKNFNLWIDEGGIRLDEVVLTAEVEKEEEVEMVYNGDMEVKKESIGYAVEKVDQDEFIKSATDVTNALKGKFTSIDFAGSNGDTTQKDITQFIVRGPSSIQGNNYGIVIIDGVPIEQSDSSKGGQIVRTTFIDPNLIEDVTLLKGPAATARYGSIAARGALIIRTKAAVARAKGKKENPLEVKDNYYDGKLIPKTYSTFYLRDLEKSKSLEEAYDRYLQLRRAYIREPQFYLDMFEYFIKVDEVSAYRILGNIIEIDGVRLEDLRAVLFMAQKYGNPDLELDVAEFIKLRYPDRLQTYLDLASAYNQNNRFQQALDLYVDMLSGNANNQLNFNSISKTINSEMVSLLKAKRKYLNVSKVPSSILNSTKNYNARLVFEWNNPNVEFDIQFVNPSKRFFNWEFGYQNEPRLRESIQFGNNTEEFEIMGAESKGKWLVNVEYTRDLDEKDLINSYIKCKVQYNYGRPNQREEIFLLRLHKVGSKEELANIKI